MPTNHVYTFCFYYVHPPNQIWMHDHFHHETSSNHLLHTRSVKNTSMQNKGRWEVCMGAKAQVTTNNNSLLYVAIGSWCVGVLLCSFIGNTCKFKPKIKAKIVTKIENFWVDKKKNSKINSNGGDTREPKP